MSTVETEAITSENSEQQLDELYLVDLFGNVELSEGLLIHWPGSGAEVELRADEQVVSPQNVVVKRSSYTSWSKYSLGSFSLEIESINAPFNRRLKLKLGSELLIVQEPLNPRGLLDFLSLLMGGLWLGLYLGEFSWSTVAGAGLFAYAYLLILRFFRKDLYLKTALVLNFLSVLVSSFLALFTDSLNQATLLGVVHLVFGAAFALGLIHEMGPVFRTDFDLDGGRYLVRRINRR